jgi:ketosteroid isomerase-like protein
VLYENNIHAKDRGCIIADSHHPFGALRAADIDSLKASLAAADSAWSAAAVARDAAKVATGYYAEDGIAYPPDFTRRRWSNRHSEDLDGCIR